LDEFISQFLLLVFYFHEIPTPELQVLITFVIAAAGGTGIKIFFPLPKKHSSHRTGSMDFL
jgi:hypothetical protein